MVADDVYRLASCRAQGAFGERMLIAIQEIRQNFTARPADGARRSCDQSAGINRLDDLSGISRHADELVIAAEPRKVIGLVRKMSGAKELVPNLPGTDVRVLGRIQTVSVRRYRRNPVLPGFVRASAIVFQIDVRVARAVYSAYCICRSGASVVGIARALAPAATLRCPIRCVGQSV